MDRQKVFDNQRDIQQSLLLTDIIKESMTEYEGTGRVKMLLPDCELLTLALSTCIESVDINGAALSGGGHSAGTSAINRSNIWPRVHQSAGNLTLVTSRLSASGPRPS